MKLKKLHLLFAVAIFLCGCVPGNRSTSLPADTLTPTPAKTATWTATLINTKTPTPESHSTSLEAYKFFPTAENLDSQINTEVLTSSEFLSDEFTTYLGQVADQIRAQNHSASVCASYGSPFRSSNDEIPINTAKFTVTPEDVASITRLRFSDLPTGQNEGFLVTFFVTG